MWDALTQEELVTFEEAVEKARQSSAGGDASQPFDEKDVLPVVGEKNAGKFTPHLVQIRSGQFNTASELQSLFSYVGGLQ